MCTAALVRQFIHLHALHVSSLGLRMDDEVVGVATVFEIRGVTLPSSQMPSMQCSGGPSGYSWVELQEKSGSFFLTYRHQ